MEADWKDNSYEFPCDNHSIHLYHFNKYKLYLLSSLCGKLLGMNIQLPFNKNYWAENQTMHLNVASGMGT